MHNGITNIVANYSDVDEKTNISMMAQDLKECITEGLSQKKWRRFDKSFDAFAEAREAARIAEKEKEKPRYSQSNISMAVVGAQGRIGATTFAMRLAAYFKSRDGESLVVCANKRGFPQLEMISEYYGGTEQNGIYTINDIDICTALTEPEKQYNVQIYDYGSMPTSELKLDLFDKVFLEYLCIDCHRNMLFIKDDAVFIIISIRRILHEPILAVDIQLYRTKILSCRVCLVTCESHIFNTKLTLRIG